ncbi:PREDICTED: uncharacterized protein LOC109159433 [Ipomoea nil]|uniref:uncharacterized protein LOC109159433 n=1 Tax=Ipomoea nil TaxID=35883 RepID=UPI000901F508|nr:PREDICTED: uncharacterized protein LOC109159433 [Ipomoea nil]
MEEGLAERGLRRREGSLEQQNHAAIEEELLEGYAGISLLDEEEMLIPAGGVVAPAMGVDRRATDLQRVIDERPWSFDNHTLVCRPVEDGMLPNDVVLDTVDMWVQVYGLPMGYTSMIIQEQVGNFLGGFLKGDERFDDRPWKAFYRIRVSIPVAKPLRRRMKFAKRDKSWCWVTFKYERLHTFCFFCGLLGHSYKFCLQARNSTLALDQYLYGVEMKAGLPRGPRPVGSSWLVPVGGKREEVAERGDPPILMSTLSWNCRGLGDPRTFREVVDMASRKKPDFIFLMETKVARDHVERLRVKLGFQGLFYVDNRGRSGGLALLWKTNDTVRLLGYSRNHVDVEYEKRGRCRHPESLLRGFGETLEDCGLIQIPMIGYQFTWEKGEGTEDWIEEKLDRVVATDEWEVVEEAWGHGVEDLQARVERCGVKLQKWGGNRFHKFGKRIASLKKQQLNCRGRLSPQALADFHRLESELVRLEKQEDVFWRQRAKQHWLRGADANTRFYHRYASARKRKNTILRLKDELGGWVDGDGMRAVVMSYFNNIFAANPDVSNGADFFASIPTHVTDTHNEWLNRPYDPGEVKDALFSMFPDKAPGPDGMNPGFYQKFWDIVGPDSPEMVTDLRPIALSNVVYKIIAKVIANRMKPLLGDIISVSQSAFIPDRLITDNILIAAEVGHFLNRKQLGKVGWGALKLDMAKAYDKMEWAFLRNMMLALGFQVGWAQDRGDVHGLRVARGAPALSHLLFADDSLLFFKANVGEAQAVKRCLTDYEKLSGQTINYNKSNICFSRNTQQVERNLVAAQFGVHQAQNFGKYLGLPAFVGRNKQAVFAYVEDKVRQRIGSWNKKLLSRADSGDAMGGMGGIHWLAWDKMSVPMKYGGLGFKDLRAFNVAMLGKQG